ncbi:MAG: glycosyltransferase [Planctomycetota bacterium]
MPAATATALPRTAVAADRLTVRYVGPEWGGLLACLRDHGIEHRPADDGATADGPGDLVLVQAPPARFAAQGQRVAQARGLPMVLDLRSPWALDGRRVFPTPVHLAFERRAMRRALRAAALVLVESPDLQRAVTALGVDPARTLALPGGFDAAQPPLCASADGAFHLLVQSELLPAVDPPVPTRDGALQRRPRQLEPVGATGFYLFSALATLRKKHPAAFARLRVHFAAPLDTSNREIAEWLEIEGCFAPPTGSTPLVADAVFVCQHGELGDARALDVPAAVFAALASERPLLAALPAGAARDLVRHFDAGVVVPATDAPPLCHAIEQAMRDAAAGAPRAGATRRDLRPFAREALAARLAPALRAAARGADVPAAAQLDWPAPDCGVGGVVGGGATGCATGCATGARA